MTFVVRHGASQNSSGRTARHTARSVLLALLSVPAALNRSWSLPILTYHAVIDSSSRIAISPMLFRQHVQHLRQAGYRTTTFTEAARVLDTTPRNSEKLVSITFDDAYRSVLENAVPVLLEAGFVATIFVPTRYVGNANLWDAASPPRGWPILNWDEIAALSREGFEIGSHTRTHPHLPSLESGLLQEELAGSRRELEDRLGVDVTSFCYPFGDHDDRTRSAVRNAGYRCACTTEFGACAPGDDAFRLRRVGTAPLRTMFDYRVALGGAFELYMRVRGRAARSD